MNNTANHCVQLNANHSVNDSDDIDSEKSIGLCELSDLDANTFDEKSYIKRILESQICDMENNNSELSDYEQAVLNKYLNEVVDQGDDDNDDDDNDDDGDDVCESHSTTHQTFPLQQLNASLTTFPTKDDEMIARHSFATDRSVACETDNVHSIDKPSSVLNQTQVVNNKRNNVSNNNHRTARNVLRRQFSIWVGVTSCLWGLLLYLDKTYF